MDQQDRGMTSKIGPVQVNLPQAVGYYGGIGLALTVGLLDPPLAIFIAAVPLFKMLGTPGFPYPVRIVSQVLNGASKPVGGDGEAAVKITDKPTSSGLLSGIGREVGSVFSEARCLARDGSAPR